MRVRARISARPAGKPGDFLIPKESLHDPSPATFFLQLPIILSAQYAFLRDGGIYRSDVIRTKTKSWDGTNRLPMAGPEAQAKERVGRTTLLLIVHDEFRTGYSSIGLLASRARLRFTGIARITLDGK